MKNNIRSGLMALVMIIVFSGCAMQPYSTLSTVSATVTFQSFYDDLIPYGTWMDYPGYGKVWHPRLEADFRPYHTNGYWIYSNEGWTWMSNYSWGWAPFHYGRWLYDDLYGWLWVPGYEWAPAWVTWGDVDDYYAWAPLMPDVNVRVQFNLWMPNLFYWNLCPRKNIYDRDLHHKIERPDRVRDFNNRISIRNNFTTTRTYKQFYSKGPDVQDVEKYSNRKIEEVKLKTVRQVNPVPETRDDRKVFRPGIPQDPQPREYKRVENDRTNLIRKYDQRPTVQNPEQKKNIERLPVFKNENRVQPDIKRPERKMEPVKEVPDQQKKPGKPGGGN